MKLLLTDTAYHMTRNILKNDGAKWTLLNRMNELSVKVAMPYFGFEILYSFVKAQIPNRERGSGGDRNSLGVEANGQGSSNR